MFVALWEYEVKPGCEERFEKVYGAQGDWARFFRRDSNYRKALLLRDAERPGLYLTLDFWKSRQAYEKFMGEHRGEYQAIDAIGEELTTKERPIGWYEQVAL